MPWFGFRFSAITERAARAYCEAVALLAAEAEWEKRVVVFDKARLQPGLADAPAAKPRAVNG